MKARSGHNSTKIGFMIFFTVTLQLLIKYHSPPYFPSRNITKNAATPSPHPPSPMRGVVIEQPLNICGVVFWLLTNHFVA